jgi:hypothetical protein
MLDRSLRNDIYSLDTLVQHFDGVTIEDFIVAVHTLGSEGRNMLNIVNQIQLANKLGGRFVGDKIDDWDIEVGEYKIELKGNTTVAQATYAKKVGFGSWIHKQGWTHFIHYLPCSFVDFIEEDKYILFTQEDREEMLKYCDNSGNLNFSSSIYLQGYEPKYRNKEKMLFLKKRIHTLTELKNKLCK